MVRCDIAASQINCPGRCVKGVVGQCEGARTIINGEVLRHSKATVDKTDIFQRNITCFGYRGTVKYKDTFFGREIFSPVSNRRSSYEIRYTCHINQGVVINSGCQQR